MVTFPLTPPRWVAPIRAVVGRRVVSARVATWRRIPAPVQTRLVRLARWARLFPWTMIGFGIMCLAHGFAFSGLGTPISRPPAGLEKLSELVAGNLWIYAIGWTVAGVACLIAVRFPVLTWTGLGAFLTMSGLWWSFYLWGWFAQLTAASPSRIYYIASMYLGLWLAVLGQLLRLVNETRAFDDPGSTDVATQ